MEMKQHVLLQVTAETRSLYLMENYFLCYNQSEINLCFGHNEVLRARQKLTKRALTKYSAANGKNTGFGVRQLDLRSWHLGLQVEVVTGGGGEAYGF